MPSETLITTDIFWSYPEAMPEGSKLWKLLGRTFAGPSPPPVLASDRRPNPLRHAGQPDWERFLMDKIYLPFYRRPELRAKQEVCRPAR